MKEEKAVDKEFLRQFEYCYKNKAKRSYSSIAADMEKLWAIDPVEAFKFVFVVRGKAKRKVRYKIRKREIIVSTIGFNSPYEAYGRLYWIANNHKNAFYANLFQIATLFGSWRDLFVLWEMDLKMHNLKVDDCVLSQCKLSDFLMNSFLDPLYGPESTALMPTIRNMKDSHTPHRIACNIIGKYLRSKMPKNANTNQNKYYRMIKRAYSGKPSYRYEKFQIKDDGLSVEQLYEKYMGQKSIGLLNIKPFLNKSL